jgi:hypothetical protein
VTTSALQQESGGMPFRDRDLLSYEPFPSVGKVALDEKAKLRVRRQERSHIIADSIVKPR